MRSGIQNSNHPRHYQQHDQPCRRIGYTITELIIVIVVIGILSTYVTTRFIRVDKDARAVALRALASRIQVTVDSVYNLCVAQGKEESGQAVLIQLGGHREVLAKFGYPLATIKGFGLAIVDPEHDASSYRATPVANQSTQSQVTAQEYRSDNPDHILLHQDGDQLEFRRDDATHPELCKVVYSYKADGKELPVVKVDTQNCL